jgi:hypothetical protein
MASSASPDLGLGLSLDPGRRTPPRPTLGLRLSLGLGRRSPPRPTQGSDSTSASEDDLCLARPRAPTQPRPRKTDSASPDPRARTQPRHRKTNSASPDPRARTQPRPRKTVSASPDPGLGLSLGLGRYSPPCPTQGSDSASTPEDGLRLARPQGSDSASTSEDELRLARPQGPDSTSTSEEPAPHPTSVSDPPRHREGHHYPTPS